VPGPLVTLVLALAGENELSRLLCQAI